MHAAVLSAFPHPDDERGRVLWRVDRDAHHVWLYVVSRYEPDFTAIVEDAGWPSTQRGWDTRPYAPVLDGLVEGQRWAFRLTANPTRSTARRGRMSEAAPEAVELNAKGRPKTRRYGHVTVEQQLNWFAGRTDDWGFTLPGEGGGVVVHDRQTRRFQRGGRTVTLVTASFDGLLEVSDPARLRDALVTGLGPAKGYGCGLLTLAPVR